MPTKRGRAADRKQVNRRQKHELAYRAKRWKCSKLAVILADIIEARMGLEAESAVLFAKAELRRAQLAAKAVRRIPA